MRDRDSYRYIACISLLTSGHLKNLPNNAISEFKLVLKEIAQGELAWEIDRGLDLLYERTHKNKLKATAKDIRDMFIREGNISPEKFVLLSDLLFKDASLDEKSSDSIRGIIFPVMQDNSCLGIIAGYTEEVKCLVSLAGNDAEDFIEELNEVLQNNYDDEIKDFAREIIDSIEKK